MNPDHDTQFDTWLDAWVGRRSTPPTLTAADAKTRDAQRSARLLHDQSRRAERVPIDPSRIPTWEDFMTSHHIALPPNGPGAPTANQQPGSAPKRPTSPSRRPSAAAYHPERTGRLNMVSNVLLAALLVLAVGAGAWLAVDRVNIGGLGQNNPPEAIPFGGVVQEEATPEPMTVFDPATIATADQCTIEPLTIDQVVAYVYDPYLADTPATGATPEFISPDDEDALATASSEVHDPAFASPGALAGATTTFHMFEACIEANSYFQLWATMKPTLIQQSILAQLPPLMGEDQFRDILADLEANGPGDPMDGETIFRPLNGITYSGPNGSGRAARVVDQNPENTWMPEAHFLVTGYDSFYPDGSPTEYETTNIYDADYDGTPDPVVGFDPRMKQPDCFRIIFQWNEARQMWLILHAPICG